MAKQMNKKAMSEIITTVIMVVLVLVAVGVVWTIVNGLIKGKAGEVDFTAKCLELDITIENALCTGTTCDVVLKRGTKGTTPSGFIFVFSNETASAQDDEEAQLEILETSTFHLSGIILNNVNKVEVRAYYLDELEEKEICPQAMASYNF